MKSVLIVGAGFSGTVCAVQLLRRGLEGGLRVILVNRSGPMARGIAYGTQSPHHLLNVPAGNMSALADDPAHFLKFCQRNNMNVTSSSFVSRRIYGDYLEWLLNGAEKTDHSRAQLTRIVGEVAGVAVDPGGSLARVSLTDGQTFEVDRVVLAFGNYPPRDPPVLSPDFYSSAHYLRDPWEPKALDAIDPAATILLLGTGLTAVDVSTHLLGRGHDRILYAMSRRGLLPQPHRISRDTMPHETLPEFSLTRVHGVRELLHLLRQHIRACADVGKDWREVMAALRPVTRLLWEQLPETERIRFLRHLQPFWDIHRHRVAPESHARFENAVTSGNLKILAGRVIAYDEDPNGVRVTMRARGAASSSELYVDYVINCTGPGSDLRRVDDVLVKQMLTEGMVETDSLGLGVAVSEDSAVINAQGEASDLLFYVGPLLKARYWEATAVPELRVFAQRLADSLLDTFENIPSGKSQNSMVEH